MAATRTLTAVDPATGARITRRTARTYVGVIVTGDPAQGKAYPQSWAGRPDLAAKQLAKWGPDSHARLAPVVSDPWATPEPAAQAEPAHAPVAEPAAPEGGRPVLTLQPGLTDGPYLAGDGISLWAFETEALARRAALALAADGAEPYLAGPGPFGPVALPLAATPEPAQAATRPTLPGEPAPLAPAPAPHGAAAPELPTLPPVAPPAPAPACLAQAGPHSPATLRAARAAQALEAAAPPAGAGVAAHRAAAAAGRPVSLAALAHDMGRSLGLAQGGRLPSRAQAPARLAPTGEGLAGQPWDPGTPAARAAVALQGERVGILWPIAQALRGEGVALPPSWATDGPVMAGDWPEARALAVLPSDCLQAAAMALAALPPVTVAQERALAACRAALAEPSRPL